MDAWQRDASKSVELVDNFLDIDEALQSYLVSLNERNTPMQQQQNANFTSDSYGLNVPTQSFLPHQQFAVSHDQTYFPTSHGAAATLETKVQPAVYDEGRTTGSIRKPAARNGVSKLEIKHSQVQEKNRMAQKRFRERQKAKIAELHQQISSLEHRVEQLMFENSSLQSHNSLLEKVLAMRDEHIKLVQQQQLADADQAEIELESGTRRASLNLTAIKGKEVKLSTETLKKMTPEDVMQIWHTYVTEISSALVEFNSQTGGSTKRLEELIDEVSMVCMRLFVMNPMACKVMQVREYHTSEIEELRRWQSALGQLNLSDGQKNEMVQLRKFLLQQLQALVEEKKTLHQTIQTMLVTQTVSHKLALEYLKTNQTVMRLRDILRIENNAMLHFCSTIIRKILRPEQVAALMVHSYPQKPDLLALTSAVAMDIGEDITVTPENGAPELPTLPDVLSTATSSGSVPAPVETLSLNNSHVSHGEEQE